MGLYNPDDFDYGELVEMERRMAKLAIFIGLMIGTVFGIGVAFIIYLATRGG